MTDCEVHLIKINDVVCNYSRRETWPVSRGTIRAATIRRGRGYTADRVALNNFGEEYYHID